MVEFDVPGHAKSWYDFIQLHVKLSQIYTMLIQFFIYVYIYVDVYVYPYYLYYAHNIFIFVFGFLFRCTAYPEVCPSTSCLGPLDPSNDVTFHLLSKLFGEVTGKMNGAGLFPENLFHLGGDEVDTTCWSQTPHIQTWLTSKNFTTDDAYMYIVEQAQNIVTSYGRETVNWEEVFNHFGTKLNKTNIIHVWLNSATLLKVVAAGYRGLISHDWYLDHVADTWQQYYLSNPTANIVDPVQQKLVLGGEAW
jgi:hexosaminidase